ncbi:MAG: arginine--tRNA ligase [Saprospiraceae bacterium]|nr:arginine--tRNA ligase [Saprospiraceae bacterium]
MSIVSLLESAAVNATKELFGHDLQPGQLPLTPTRKEFAGDYTLVVFPLTKIARKSPDAIAAELGEWMVSNVEEVTGYNVIKGFLNVELGTTYWNNFLRKAVNTKNYGRQAPNGKRVIVEFASPNTNKPLHLGHIRNILLGWSCSKILEAAGYNVINVQVVNDRGIAICKSMLAWNLFGEGETPESSGIKGDHLVGKYYVAFESRFKEEYAAWQASSTGKEIVENHQKENETEAEFFGRYKNTYFNEYSALGKQAKAMLLAWEAGDAETVALWKQMNSWVYAGFDQTYAQLGVHFDKLYFESDTYLLGKAIVEKGLSDGLFQKKQDGSVFVDLKDVGLDEKTLLRKDGTSLYITQDLGTARIRYDDFGAKHMVYVVADEQNYHFKALFETLKKLGEPYADGLHHLAYGMVDLPTGKMKSREGTVVDADDLMAEVIGEARENTKERGELDSLSADEREDIIRKIGLAALKYFIIRVTPQKRMIFDPKESVDLQGQTGPYIQNAYVRIKSVLRKAGELNSGSFEDYRGLEEQERELLILLAKFPELVEAAAAEYDPSEIANYCYALAKEYHRFYHEHSILNCDSENVKKFRLDLSSLTAEVLETGMDLLGIEMPDRM